MKLVVNIHRLLSKSLNQTINKTALNKQKYKLPSLLGKTNEK